MTVKFIQFFDILPDKQEEFDHFALKNYIPGMDETGLLKMAGSWRVASGEGPTHILESVAESLNDVNNVLQMDYIKRLNHLFHFLITNYKTKIMAPTGYLESEIPKGTHFRFNHHYDINFEQFDQYSAFMKDDHIPTMERLGIRMVGGWYVAIGPGPNIVVEGAASSVQKILDAIGSNEYRSLTDRLLTMVTKLGSKILAPTGLVS
jgi:hypothetical protein